MSEPKLTPEQMQRLNAEQGKNTAKKPKQSKSEQPSAQSAEDAGSLLAQSVSTQNNLGRETLTQAATDGRNLAVQKVTHFLSAFAQTEAALWGEVNNALSTVRSEVLDPDSIEVEGETPDEVSDFFGQSLLKGLSCQPASLPQTATAQPAKLPEFSAKSSGQNGSTSFPKG